MGADGFSVFRKTAWWRLQDALELLAPPSLQPNAADADKRHLLGAMYLAGYAIECILKAYIISHNPPSTTLTEVESALRNSGKLGKDLAGAAGHNLILLLQLTDLEHTLVQNPKMTKQWAIAQAWHSTWRYNIRVPTRTRA